MKVIMAMSMSTMIPIIMWIKKEPPSYLIYCTRLMVAYNPTFLPSSLSGSNAKKKGIFVTHHDEEEYKLLDNAMLCLLWGCHSCKNSGYQIL